MNRTIKFRGKRVDNGEWVYGYYFVGMNDTHWIVTSEFIFIPIQKETVGQFTGLLDKNGKEIYEGDFMKLKYPNDLRHNTNAIIVFDEKTKSLRFKVYESTEYYVLYNHFPKYLNFEIIGNIHDNPELLEVK